MMSNSTVYFGLTSFIGMLWSLGMAELSDHILVTLMWFAMAIFWGWQWWRVMSDHRAEMMAKLEAIKREIAELEKLQQNESKS